jgi:hypothetical protein
MWVKQCHKPPMTGNGNRTTFKNGDDWGVAYGVALPTLYNVFLQRKHINDFKQ